MEQNSSWINVSSAGQEIPLLYGTRRSITLSRHPASSPSTQTYHFSPISSSSILLYSPVSTQIFQVYIFHSEFTHQNAICTSPLPSTFYMSRPPNSSLFYHPNNIWRGIHTMKLHIIRFSPLSCVVPFRPTCLLQYPIVDHSKPTFFPQLETSR